MIYDCFLFNNELDTLDIRLHELDHVVDKFVLVEATVNHVNKPKPLYFEENKNRFKKFQDKIIHIVVKDTPDVTLSWIINDFQFSQIARGLRDCKKGDTILISDLDEIPKAEKIREWKDKKGKLKVFEQILTYYFLNCVEYAKAPWKGTHMIKYEDFKGYKTPWILKFSVADTVIQDGGWHLSYLGGVKKIQEKIVQQTHQEYNKEKYNTPEKIMKAMRSLRDPYGHGMRFKIVDPAFLPTYVLKNKKKFAHLFAPVNFETTKLTTFDSFVLDTKHSLRVVIRKLRTRLS